jgi:hypothetical protein
MHIMAKNIIIESDVFVAADNYVVKQQHCYQQEAIIIIIMSGQRK